MDYDIQPESGDMSDDYIEGERGWSLQPATTDDISVVQADGWYFDAETGVHIYDNVTIHGRLFVATD